MARTGLFYKFLIFENFLERVRFPNENIYMEPWLILAAAGAGLVGIWLAVSSSARDALSAVSEGTADVVKAAGEGASVAVSGLQTGAQAVGGAVLAVQDHLDGKPPGQFVEFMNPRLFESLCLLAPRVHSFSATASDWRALDAYLKVMSENMALAGQWGMDSTNAGMLHELKAWRPWYVEQGIVSAS